LSIDAMHWVWNRSQTKGNPRLVMLTVADKAPGLDCITRIGMTELIKRLNASRSTVQAALDKALESRELVELEKARGTRPALYQLPFAVGYRRSDDDASGPESGPLGQSQGPESRAATPQQGPEIRAGGEDARGPKSGPEGPEIRASRGPKSGPLYQPSSTIGGSIERSPAVGPQIPDFATDLYRQLNNAGMAVTWQLSDTEWFKIHAHIKRCGPEFIVAFTRDRWNHSNPPQTARYLTRIWDQMPDAPQGAEQPGTSGTPALRGVPGPAGPLTNNQRKRALLAEAAAQLAGGTG
jgi:hypothetical protein